MMGSTGSTMAKVGIVGCGGIAQVHAAVLDRLEATTLAACADIAPDRAASMAARYGCRAYDSMAAMLEAERLDAVHLCTPHHLHAPMAEAAAARGVAVFTEKPPVISGEQWRQLERAAARVPVGVCFQNRYRPNVQRLRRLIEDGIFGAPVGARAFVTWRREAPYYRDSDWRGAWATEGGGALINQSIHTLDLLVWLLGAPQAVEARLSNHHLKGVIEVEDTVEAYMLLGGRPAVFYATNAYTQDAPVFLEVQAQRATLRLSGDALEIVEGGETRLETFAQPETLGKGYWGNGHMPCIEDFYCCLESGAPYGNDLASVRDTVQTMLQIYGQNPKTL